MSNPTLKEAEARIFADDQSQSIQEEGLSIHKGFDAAVQEAALKVIEQNQRKRCSRGHPVS